VYLSINASSPLSTYSDTTEYGGRRFGNLTILAFNNPEDVPVHERPTYKMSQKQYNKAKNLLKFASFIQFTLPGVPCIYYGDEIGMYGFRDPYNRLGFSHNNKDEDFVDEDKTKDKEIKSELNGLLKSLGDEIVKFAKQTELLL